MEKDLYELRPYIYGAISAVAFLAAKGSALSVISGLLLLTSAALVVRMRYSYRRNLAVYIQEMRRQR